MSMQSRAMGGAFLGRMRGIGANKLGAVVLWLASVYTTGLLIDSMRASTSGYAGQGVVSWFVAMLWGSSFLAAIALQMLLTLGERSVWLRGEWDMVSGVSVLIDIGVNAAALYPFAKNFDKTPIWFMITDVTGLDPSFGPVAAFTVALLGGILGAAGPEKLWSRG